jgi:hypothetical protein
MHPASLPGCAQQHGGDGLLEPGVSIGDDQLHPAQTSRLQAAEERGPERAVLRVADGESEHFAPAIGPDAGGDHHCLRYDAVVDPGLAVGGVEEHVRKRLIDEGSVAEGADLGVQVGADP